MPAIKEIEREKEIHYINIGGSALYNIIQNIQLADVDKSDKHFVDLFRFQVPNGLTEMCGLANERMTKGTKFF